MRVIYLIEMLLPVSGGFCNVVSSLFRKGSQQGSVLPCRSVARRHGTGNTGFLLDLWYRRHLSNLELIPLTRSLVR